MGDEIAKWQAPATPPLPEHTSRWDEAYFAAFGPDIEEHAKRHPEFAERMLAARGVLGDMLRYEAVRRAVVPVYRPIYQRGELVGHEEVRDNKHLEWMLERLDPEEFNLARKLEVSGKGGGAVKFEFQLGESPLELEEGDFSEG